MLQDIRAFCFYEIVMLLLPQFSQFICEQQQGV